MSFFIGWPVFLVKKTVPRWEIGPPAWLKFPQKSRVPHWVFWRIPAIPTINLPWPKLNSILTIDDSDPNKIVDGISEFLIDVSEKNNIKRTKGKTRVVGNSPWFDEECSKLKREINSLGKTIKCHPKDKSHKAELVKLKRILKKTVRRKKSQYKTALVQKMEWSRKDSKNFWKLLDKFEKQKDDGVFKECISGERWVNHYKSILQSQNNDNELPRNSCLEGPLDYEISKEELEMSAYILKPGKATGYDCISNEMISCLFEVNPEVIRKLFNALIKFPSIIKN